MYFSFVIGYIVKITRYNHISLLTIIYNTFLRNETPMQTPNSRPGRPIEYISSNVRVIDQFKTHSNKVFDSREQRDTGNI